MGRFTDFVKKEKAMLAERHHKREVEQEKRDLQRFQDQRAEAIATEARASREERAVRSETQLSSARQRLAAAKAKRAPTTFQKAQRFAVSEVRKQVARSAAAKKTEAQRQARQPKRQPGLMDDLFGAPPPKRTPRRTTGRRTAKRKTKRPKTFIDDIFS